MVYEAKRKLLYRLWGQAHHKWANRRRSHMLSAIRRRTVGSYSTEYGVLVLRTRTLQITPSAAPHFAVGLRECLKYCKA